MSAWRGKALSITKTDENGHFVIDEDALSSILSKEAIGDHPISIISIAGCLRRGKSFLLNFLLRYLRQEGWKNRGWIGSEDTRADEGIQWRGGHHPCTKEIIIWDEIFQIKRQDGQILSVLLMDTQGFFDTATTKDDNVKLFTMSALMSSVQILNIPNLIEERDLENLQLCAEYAPASVRQGGSSFKLQTLLFLIRDWAKDDEYSFGFEGGQEYIDEILKTRPEKEELNKVRRHLKESFTELKCFLMPHPGLKVTKNGFKGTNREIDSEFLDHVARVVAEILAPDKIAVKEIAGQPITANLLRHLVVAANRAFADGKIPKAETHLEAQERAFYGYWVQELTNLYVKILTEEVAKCGEILLPEELDNCRQKASKTILDQYDKSPKIGCGIIRCQCRDELKVDTERHFRTKEKANDEKLKRAWQMKMKSEGMSGFFRELERNYKDKLTEYMETYPSDTDFRNFSQKTKDDTTEEIDRNLDTLKKKLITIQTSAAEENRNKLREVNRKAIEFSSRYESRMDKKMADALERCHKEVSSEILSEIRATCADPAKREIEKRVLPKLQDAYCERRNVLDSKGKNQAIQAETSTRPDPPGPHRQSKQPEEAQAGRLKAPSDISTSRADTGNPHSRVGAKSTTAATSTREYQPIHAKTVANKPQAISGLGTVGIAAGNVFPDSAAVASALQGVWGRREPADKPRTLKDEEDRSTNPFHTMAKLAASAATEYGVGATVARQVGVPYGALGAPWLADYFSK